MNYDFEYDHQDENIYNLDVIQLGDHVNCQIIIEYLIADIAN